MVLLFQLNTHPADYGNIFFVFLVIHIVKYNMLFSCSTIFEGFKFNSCVGKGSFGKRNMTILMLLMIVKMVTMMTLMVMLMI